MTSSPYRLSGEGELTDPVEPVAGAVNQQNPLSGTAPDGPAIGAVNQQHPLSGITPDGPDVNHTVRRRHGRQFSKPVSLRARDGSQERGDAFRAGLAAMRGRGVPLFDLNLPGDRIKGKERMMRPDDMVMESNEWEDDDFDIDFSHLISPSTFATFAQGYERWDAGHVRDPDNVLATATRMRPMGPSAPREDHYPHYLTHRVRQYDIRTGEEISPLYDVPIDPSIIYTPPGVNEDAPAPQVFRDKYSRMAPLAARDVRDHQAGLTAPGWEAAGTTEHFTASDAYRVINQGHDPCFVPLPGKLFEQFLAEQYNEVAAQQISNNLAWDMFRDQRARIRDLQAKEAKLRDACAAIRALQREQRQEQAHLERDVKKTIRARSERDERVRYYMRNQLRDAEDQLRRARQRGAEHQAQIAAQAQQLRDLEHEIREQCLMHGHTTPEGVHREVQLARLGRPHPKPDGYPSAAQRRYQEMRDSRRPADNDARFRERRHKKADVKVPNAPGPVEWPGRV
ncbi:hypothetical protein F4818DRAFT_451257 [Hypoxylon cercidicola]|nr:hypothetical protein F4818DRAFT_451257 [Hypoxylon cercidicola]